MLSAHLGSRKGAEYVGLSSVVLLSIQVQGALVRESGPLCPACCHVLLLNLPRLSHCSPCLRSFQKLLPTTFLPH